MDYDTQTFAFLKNEDAVRVVNIENKSQLYPTIAGLFVFLSSKWSIKILNNNEIKINRQTGKNKATNKLFKKHTNLL